MSARDRIALNYGLLAGLMYSVLIYFYYLWDKSLFVSGWKTIPFLLVLGLMLWAGFMQRQQADEPIDFKALLRFLFIIFLVAEVISQLFYYTLYNYIDPSLLNYVKEQMIETYQQMAEAAGKQEEAQSKIEQYQNQDFQMTLGTMFSGLARWLIFGFLYSCLLAFFFKTTSSQSRESS